MNTCNANYLVWAKCIVINIIWHSDDGAKSGSTTEKRLECVLLISADFESAWVQVVVRVHVRSYVYIVHKYACMRDFQIPTWEPS